MPPTTARKPRGPDAKVGDKRNLGNVDKRKQLRMAAAEALSSSEDLIDPSDLTTSLGGLVDHGAADNSKQRISDRQDGATKIVWFDTQQEQAVNPDLQIDSSLHGDLDGRVDARSMAMDNSLIAHENEDTSGQHEQHHHDGVHEDETGEFHPQIEDASEAGLRNAGSDFNGDDTTQIHHVPGTSSFHGGGVSSSDKLSRTPRAMNARTHQMSHLTDDGSMSRAMSYRDQAFRTATRRWTDEETNALLQILGDVKADMAPSWVYLERKYGGPGGPLEGRTQGQIKDKARNIKQFFIKRDGNVPPGFENVTVTKQRNLIR